MLEGAVHFSQVRTSPKTNHPYSSSKAAGRECSQVAERSIEAFPLGKRPPCCLGAAGHARSRARVRPSYHSLVIYRQRRDASLVIASRRDLTHLEVSRPTATCPPRRHTFRQTGRIFLYTLAQVASDSPRSGEEFYPIRYTGLSSVQGAGCPRRAFSFLLFSF